ncbi:MAG: transcription termination/antitermination protein NusG [Desulfatiglandales bacterium]
MRKWYVIYTKPQKEEFVSSLLERARIESFWPKLMTYKFVNSHREPVIKSLFPAYLFSRFSYPEEYDLVRWTWGVKKVVGTAEGPIPVPEELIDFIKENSRDGVVEIRPKNLLNGDLVRILYGPFKGLVGIFERHMNDRERAMVLLQALYEIRVEIKTYYLEPIGCPSFG